ncbi:MAG: glycosyltransferase family 39 protein [Nitrososphaerales archaeon]
MKEKKADLPNYKQKQNLVRTAIDSLISRFQIRDLILISFALHLLAIGFPSDGGTVFDEKYYVAAANDILKGVPSNPEHPFLGKLWGAIGIAIFGNNWFGWRIPMVAFGLLTIYVFYNLAKLFLSERRALLAATFLSFDTIFFLHSSLLLLEVPTLFFAILGFYLYFKDRYLLAAAAFGFSILSKEWGILFVLALFIYHMVTKRPVSLKGLNVKKPMLVKTAKFAVAMIIVVMVPLWVYSSVYKPPTSAEVQVTVIKLVDEEGNIVGTTTSSTTVSKGEIRNPIDQIKYILTYQSALTIKNQTATQFWEHYAWGWVIPYNVDPPKYYENEVRKEVVTKAGDVVIKREVEESHPISWKGIGNFPIWLSIWAIVPFASINIIKKKASKLDYLIIAWIVATFFSWFYVSGVMGRIVYAFYFINVVPILALSIPYFIASVSRGNSKAEGIITFIWLAATIIFFLYYYPVNVFDFG